MLLENHNLKFKAESQLIKLLKRNKVFKLLRLWLHLNQTREYQMVMKITEMMQVQIKNKLVHQRLKHQRVLKRLRIWIIQFVDHHKDNKSLKFLIINKQKHNQNHNQRPNNKFHNKMALIRELLMIFWMSYQFKTSFKINKMVVWNLLLSHLKEAMAVWCSLKRETDHNQFNNKIK